MKIVRWNYAFLLSAGLFCLQPSVFAQNSPNDEKTITITLNGVPMVRFLKDVQKLTRLKLIYKEAEMQNLPPVTIRANGEKATDVIDRVLRNAGIPYVYTDKAIIINRRIQKVNGTVVDAKTKEPLIGATVREPLLGKGTITNEKGEFTLGTVGEGELVFSYMGYEPQHVKVTTGKSLYVTLSQEKGQELKEVVVTGIVNRKASSFTGSISSFNQEDLQKVGSQNLVKSLQALEPSMLQVTNLGVGSNPNAMPTLELNGTSSFNDVTGKYNGNPNQPLFILNGFESDLQTIMDLDMNLVKSVTILKDASAKAIYGSKAANGVVIVETNRPKPGKLQVYYSGAVTMEVPDLTSYNLANAKEKLQAELLSDNVYGQETTPQGDVNSWNIYNQLHKETLRGVDTYWLSVPLRTGVGQKHTLSVDGGNENYIYGLNLSYNKITGAMRGSDRTTLSGDMSIEYRINQLSIRNLVSVDYNKQNDPYHSFSDYAQQNPYWRKYDDQGKPVKQFLSVRDGMYNPLWDDQWLAYNKTNYTQLTDNLDVDWTILPQLRLVGRFNFTKLNTQTDAFRSPYLLEFQNADNDEKGSYSKGNSNSFQMGGDLNLSYSHTIADKHIFFYNVGTSFQTTNDDSYDFSAYGFPNETDFLYFAKGYKVDDRPSADESKTRELSFLGIFNYSFEDRYMLDASIRTTGSSQFGRDKRWGTFWSTGLGWNVQNEPFIKNHDISKVINLLKIRGSIGYSGSQNFNAYQSLATYNFYSKYYFGGDNGSYLAAFPNSKLQWQSKYDKNVGVDLTLWNKFNLTFNYYVSTTKNSISSLTVAPSIGFGSYTENIGDIENKGYDLNVSYNVFSIPSTRSYLNLNFSVASNKNVIKRISDALKAYNATMDAKKSQAEVDANHSYADITRPEARYVEGRSMTAIWGVRSAGIDPLTGKEVYIRPNGDYTYVWDAKDQTVIGDSRPKAHGTFGFNFSLKGFELNTVCTYQVGGDYYNTTLVDKVENADIYYNVDRRYLYDRWKKPGDISLYKNIADATTTRPTSRFVMKNNEMTLSSVNVAYDFRYWKFMKRWGLNSLRFAFYVNDIATFSTVKQERGTDYPFARNYNFQVSLNF